MKIALAMVILSGFVVTIVGNLLAAGQQESWHQEGLGVNAGLRRIIVLVLMSVAAILLLIALVVAVDEIDWAKDWWDRWLRETPVEKIEPLKQVGPRLPYRDPKNTHRPIKRRKAPVVPTQEQRRPTPDAPTNEQVVTVITAEPAVVPVVISVEAPSREIPLPSWVLLDTRWEWITPSYLQRCLYWVRCEGPHQCESMWTCT